MFQDLLQNVVGMPPLSGSVASSRQALEQRPLLTGRGRADPSRLSTDVVGSVLVSIYSFLLWGWLWLLERIRVLTSRMGLVVSIFVEQEPHEVVLRMSLVMRRMLWETGGSQNLGVMDLARNGL